jgi:hypothetical protein
MVTRRLALEQDDPLSKDHFTPVGTRKGSVPISEATSTNVIIWTVRSPAGRNNDNLGERHDYSWAIITHTEYTSKHCDTYGFINDRLGSSITCSCPKCSSVDDRDIRAALPTLR